MAIKQGNLVYFVYCQLLTFAYICLYLKPSVKSVVHSGSSSPEMVFVSNCGASDFAPNRPPPPYNSSHHQQHHYNKHSGQAREISSLTSSALVSKNTDCSSINSPTSPSSSTSLFQSMSSSGSSQSGGDNGADQYFLPGMGSTIVMKSSSSSSSNESKVMHSLTSASSHPSHQLYHAPIPESKRICFQTKEMEEIFNQSQYDIDTLLVRLEEVERTHESRLRQSSKHQEMRNHHLKDGSPPSSARETLIVESRHFVTASKFFVKCATEGSFQLIDYLTECVTLLERMFHASETVIFEMESGAQVTCLVDRLKEVAATYAYTVDTVRRLVGFSPSIDASLSETPENLVQVEDGMSIASKRPNPFLDLLMNHATSLATCLSTLMRTLRAMN